MNRSGILPCLFLSTILSLPVTQAQPGNKSVTDPVNIGSRLELFVDSLLVENLNGVELCLHSPVKLSLPESPVKGGYMTVIKDGDLYRAYYRVIDENVAGEKTDGTTAEYTCYAESKDGHEWTFPYLGKQEITM